MHKKLSNEMLDKDESKKSGSKMVILYFSERLPEARARLLLALKNLVQCKCKLFSLSGNLIFTISTKTEVFFERSNLTTGNFKSSRSTETYCILF